MSATAYGNRKPPMLRYSEGTAMSKARIFTEIRKERQRQNKLWGGRAHDRAHTVDDWAGFISQRADELQMRDEGRERTRELFLHIAALAVAALEVLP